MGSRLDLGGIQEQVGNHEQAAHPAIVSGPPSGVSFDPMKLHEHRQPQLNLVSRHGEGRVVIEGREITLPCIVAPGVMHTDWIATLSALSMDSLSIVWPLQPRILLLGSDARGGVAVRDTLRLVGRQLAARDISLEAMDLGAACRTYNVLAQEDRAVAALLFPGV
jgi:uncharacterized protein